MLWLIVIIIAHLLNAVVFVVDKYLLSHRFPQPYIYSFYIGILGLIALLLLPFGVLVWPTTTHLMINLASGFLFIAAVTLFFWALQRQESSRVVPIVGSLVSILTVPLSYLILREKLSGSILWAVILLLVGGALIALKKFQFNRQFWGNLALWLSAGLLFALSYVAIDFIYAYQPFLSAFIWARFGGFLTAMLLLLIPAARKSILAAVKSPRVSTNFLFLGNQFLAASGFLILNFALTLTSATLVNALQGLQYVFVLIIAIVVGKRYPQLLLEEVSLPIIFQKSLAVILICAGIYFLFL